MIDHAKKLGLTIMLFTVVISREEKLYVALASDADVASQGASIKETLANLEEALEWYLDNENTIDS